MRKIRILNIVPDIYTEGIAVSVKDRQALAAALKEETGGLVELESRIVEGGSESIECFYDSALAAPYILKLAQQGEKDGFDAIVLDCFLDPALSECRELVRIPVMGACQSSCSLAARMAGRFSVIGILDNATAVFVKISGVIALNGSWHPFRSFTCQWWNFTTVRRLSWTRLRRLPTKRYGRMAPGR